VIEISAQLASAMDCHGTSAWSAKGGHRFSPKCDQLNESSTCFGAGSPIRAKPDPVQVDRKWL